MQNSSSTSGCRELQWLCRSTLQAAFPSFRTADVLATFYPYLGLTHTIRHKESKWVLRISDHCQGAPRAVLEAITIILGCKVLRRPPPTEAVRAYKRFREDPAVQEAVQERQRLRGRKRISSLDGSCHSLSQIYLEVNNLYFNGQIEIRKLGWGPKRSWRRLGHYDPIHHTITVSPVLDSPRVPRFVIAFVLYHEMLHDLFSNEPSRGTKRHHPREFQQAEKAHPDYLRAKNFLEAYCRRRKC
jgi:hypothetical protein